MSSDRNRQHVLGPDVVFRALVAGVFLLLELPILLPLIVGAPVMAVVVRIAALRRDPSTRPKDNTQDETRA